jgi:hypothetical protein
VIGLWVIGLCMIGLCVMGTATPARAQSTDAPAASSRPSSPEITPRGSTASEDDTTRSAGEQRVTMTFRDVPLAAALERVAAATQVSLVYDSELVRNRRVFCSVSDATAAGVLRCLLREEPLDFVVTSSGTFVIIESARQRPQYGTLAGVVVDEATGEPLPNANVLLADASTGTATDDAGLFTFASLVGGSHRVVVTYVGYETEVREVQVTPGQKTRRRIEMEAKTVATEPVVIDGLQRRLPSGGLGHRAFTSDRLERPSTTGTPDVARAAGSMMGVTTGRPLANLYIQGSSNGEHQMQLDGVPVRNPVSLGRLLSAFSPLALGRLTTHKAGFGVMQGSHLSGLVELEHDLRRPGTQYATVQADPVSVNGRVQSPATVAGMDATVMAAARVGMWSVYRDPVLENLIERWSSLDPVLTGAWNSSGFAAASSLQSESASPTSQFYDLHGAARLEISPYRYLHVSGYHGSSSLGASLVLASPEGGPQYDPGSGGGSNFAGRNRPGGMQRVPTYDRYEWSNTVAQARYQWLAGARADASVRGYYSRYASTSTYEIGWVENSTLNGGSRSARPPSELNRVNELGLEANLDLSLSSATHVDLSASGQYLSSQFRVGNAFIPTLDHHVRTMRWTAAGKIESTVGLNTTLEAGTRLTYVPARRTLYAEPRGAIRYDRSVGGVGDVAVRVAGGLYRQYTNQFDLSRDGATAVVPTAHVWLPVDHSLAPQRAVHLAGDVLWMPSDPWSVTLESYVKWQPHLLAVDYPTLQEYGASGIPASARPLNQSSFIASSRGRAYGAGARVSYDVDRLRSTLSYTYSAAKRTVPHRFDGRMLPTPWNEPHRLTLRTSATVAGGLTAHLQADGIWGRTWGFRQAYYDYLAPITCPLGSDCAAAALNADAVDAGSFSSVSFAALPPYELDDPSDHVLPPMYRVDAGLSYARSFRGFDLQAQVNVVNVLDRANVVEWRLQPQSDGTHRRFARTLPGRHPVFSIRISY